MSGKKCPATILVVDDKAMVLSSVVRFCELFFDSVLAAATPAEAERHLEQQSPPFMLCDYWLGPNLPTAAELIPRWRRDYPCLRCVALMTGTKASALEGLEGVDAIFQKPMRLEAVVDFFLTRYAAS